MSGRSYLVENPGIPYGGWLRWTKEEVENSNQKRPSKNGLFCCPDAVPVGKSIPEERTPHKKRQPRFEQLNESAVYPSQ